MGNAGCLYTTTIFLLKNWKGNVSRDPHEKAASSGTRFEKGTATLDFNSKQQQLKKK